MNITALTYAILVMGVLGFAFGLMLDVADKKLQVKADERISQIRACLSGANCGACGYAGCDAFASAVVEGKVLPNGCLAGGSSTANAIAQILNVHTDFADPSVARMICQGTEEAAKAQYTYDGYQRCSLAVTLGGGPKQCQYACVGLGDCVRACKFDAITLKDGIAQIDEKKCTQCGACVKACPRSVIRLQPSGAKILVRCNNKDAGRLSRLVCARACISCGRCEKACKYDAIHVIDRLAVIDDSKCTSCKDCVDVCPNKCITIQ